MTPGALGLSRGPVARCPVCGVIKPGTCRNDEGEKIWFPHGTRGNEEQESPAAVSSAATGLADPREASRE